MNEFKFAIETNLNLPLFLRVLKWLEAGAPETRAVERFDMGVGLTINPLVGLTIDHLEAAADELGLVIKDGLHARATACGTVCCMAGAMCVFEAETNLQVFDETTLRNGTFPSCNGLTFDWADVEDAARRLGRLEAEQAQELFMPPHGGDLSIYSAAQAAFVLRTFLITGVIDWSEEAWDLSAGRQKRGSYRND